MCKRLYSKGTSNNTITGDCIIQNSDIIINNNHKNPNSCAQSRQDGGKKGKNCLFYIFSKWIKNSHKDFKIKKNEKMFKNQINLQKLITRWGIKITIKKSKT